MLIAYFAGVEHLSTYLKVYKIGDIVDVKVSKLQFNMIVRVTNDVMVSYLTVSLPRVMEPFKEGCLTSFTMGKPGEFTTSPRGRWESS